MEASTPRVTFRSPYAADFLWEKLIEQAVAHRVELAREFLKRLAGNEQWKTQLLSRVGRLVEEDHKIEALIRMSMEKAVTFSTVDLLFHLKRKNPHYADRMYRAALQKAAAQRDIRALYWLGAYALPGIALPDQFPRAEPSSPDFQIARLYLETLVKVLAQEVLATPRIPSHLYRTLVSIRPYAEQFAPEIVTRIDNLLSFITSRLPAQEHAEAERRDRERASPTEEKAEDLLLEAQLVRDERTHDALIARATSLLIEQQDFDRALSVALRAKDRKIWQELKDLVCFDTVSHLREKGSLSDAQRYLLSIENPERLAIAAAALIEKLEDEEHLTTFLARVQSQLEWLPNEGGKARALLYLAHAVLARDPVQGESLLARAIDGFNKTRADLKVEGAVIKIEIGDFAIGRVVGAFDLAPVVIAAFQKLVQQKGDISRALTLAASWNSPEIRALAYAALARAVLEKPMLKNPTGARSDRSGCAL